MIKNFFAVMLVIGSITTLSGCGSSKAQIVDSESESQVQIRSYQAREYSVVKLVAVRSVVSVLQDLGFVIDQADELTGTVSGTKLDGYRLVMTVTVRQNGEIAKIRANAQANMEAITDPEIYQDFFTSLDKGIFLETNLP